MTRKQADGPTRNKERTKNKILDALGEIIAEQGFSKLTVMKIARKAGIDKKLIYTYWGGFDGIIKAYLDSRPFLENGPEGLSGNRSDPGKDILYQFLEKQFNSLIENEEKSGIIAWELSENLKPLKDLDQKNEQWRDRFFDKITDENCTDNNINFKAIGAVLLGGIYYLSLNTHKNNSRFCGIDMKQKKSQQEIKKALKYIIECTYHN